MNCYCLEYSDNWLHLYCYNHNVSADTSFGLLRVFHVELGGPTQNLELNPLFEPQGVNCSNSVDHDRVQMLSYSKYSLLVLLVVGIEPATSRWFYSEAFSN